MNQTHEPRTGTPQEVGPMVRVRRAEGYYVPPGPTRRFDVAHFRRQAWIAYLFIGGLVFVGLWILAWDLGWIPGR